MALEAPVVRDPRVALTGDTPGVLPGTQLHHSRSRSGSVLSLEKIGQRG